MCYTGDMKKFYTVKIVASNDNDKINLAYSSGADCRDLADEIWNYFLKRSEDDDRIHACRLDYDVTLEMYDDDDKLIRMMRLDDCGWVKVDA